MIDSQHADEPDAHSLDDDLFALEEDNVATQEGVPEPSDVDRLARARHCLTSGPPLFIIQRSHQHSGVVPSALNHIRRQHGSVLNLGVAVPLPRTRPAGVANFFRDTQVAPIQIADPECFARHDSYGPVLMEQREGQPYAGPSTSKHWEYFSEELPAGWTADWVIKVIRAQREVGATVLLTPGVWMDASDRVNSLRLMRESASWARREVHQHENLAVNITISHAWLSTPVLRDALLAELLDMDEDIFYVRVRWPLLSQPYGQLISPDILDGYMELSDVCAENDKFLILPNTGLTGWVSLAWGASGFSTGIGSGERSFADTKVIKIKRTGPRPAPTNRTFRQGLLHVVDVTTDERLSALPGQSSCGCPFCRAQPRGSWDKAQAGAHYLSAVAELTAQAATHARGVRTGARALVREANQLLSDATNLVPLTGANDPKHLDLWMNRLR
ncbi:hypothetical protein ACFWWS_24955 [Streptomyces sp. NPDC059083]|uniref:hypothetical protein n=1 Tax=unclassified Streptomyces TaxID=2593676 RepID=UPI0036A0C607